MSELGKIPDEGDSVIYKGYNFVVDAMDRFRIQMVRIQCTDQPDQNTNL
jgi:CBS domain containing-hemolysin-like protein